MFYRDGKEPGGASWRAFGIKAEEPVYEGNLQRLISVEGKLAVLTINGIKHAVDAPGDTRLLWIIREYLRLTGTKFGCGAGLCGACTVHMNGEAVRSCQVEVQDAYDTRITTIEGLDPKGQHPLQRAWVAEQVPQCGYCQSGQIMQAAALLNANPDPSDADIVDSMRGNICRCMAYIRIKKAIKRAAMEA